MADKLPKLRDPQPPTNDKLGYENADIRSMPHLAQGVTMFERGNTDAWIAAEDDAYVEDVTEVN
jgi:hypothetical protein